MEKIFSINKWSVGLCAMIVLFYAAFQVTANERLAAVAEMRARHIFSWQWRGSGRSHCIIDKAEVLKRSDTDATVRIKAREQIEQEQEGKFLKKDPELVTSALLTFYRSDKDWVLAKVEFE